jgi:AcrR family transcriptional regulator
MGPAERRAQILAAAAPCFARRGYAATGTRDLARAAGISEPILYRHFDGKRGLFEAVLEDAGRRLSETLGRIVAGRRGAGGRLRALAGALPALLDEHRDDLRLLASAGMAGEEPGIREAGSACARRVGEALGAAFDGSGLRRGVDAGTAGYLLLEIGLGAAALRPLAIPEMDGGAFVERAVEALLGGLSG